MDIKTLTTFFMWCTIINGALFIYWVLICKFAPDFVYRMQSKWVSISRETYNVLMYSFLGLFKIIFLVFIVIPYVALLIIG
jgi:hypothetical protein